MNILHMKYAVEVAKCGSINRAAEKLIIGQPNLSRAIKELEASLNTKIFERSARGMTLTAEGAMFITYAKNILKQVDVVEETFRSGFKIKRRFTVATPHISYISKAIAEFSRLVNDKEGTELVFEETSDTGAIDKVVGSDCDLGIIRYAGEYDRYYKTMLEDKKLSGELITEFVYTPVMSRKCPLAEKKSISPEDTEPYIEIVRSGKYDQPPIKAEERRETLTGVRRRIWVSGRGSRFEMLSENPQTFMLASPIPKQTLKRYGLVQYTGNGFGQTYKDVLIYRQSYTPSEIDRMFIERLSEKKCEIEKKEN